MQKQNSSRTGFTACTGNPVVARSVVTYMEFHDPVFIELYRYPSDPVVIDKELYRSCRLQQSHMVSKSQGVASRLCSVNEPSLTPPVVVVCIVNFSSV